jgi:hypothetical protein
LITTLEAALIVFMAIFQRDTTLTSDLLRVITALPNLTKLEINGHSSGSYDPRLLCELASTARTAQEGGAKKGLKDLRLILPDRGLAEVLVELVAELAGKKGGEGDCGEDLGTAVDCGLTGLEIISQVRSASLNRSAFCNQRKLTLSVARLTRTHGSSTTTSSSRSLRICPTSARSSSSDVVTSDPEACSPC